MRHALLVLAWLFSMPVWGWNDDAATDRDRPHFLHAPRRGAFVRVESAETAYWRTRFSGARRLAPPIF